MGGRSVARAAWRFRRSARAGCRGAAGRRGTNAPVALERARSIAATPSLAAPDEIGVEADHRVAAAHRAALDGFEQERRARRGRAAASGRPRPGSPGRRPEWSRRRRRLAGRVGSRRSARNRASTIMDQSCRRRRSPGAAPRWLTVTPRSCADLRDVFGDQVVAHAGRAAGPAIALGLLGGRDERRHGRGRDLEHGAGVRCRSARCRPCRPASRRCGSPPRPARSSLAALRARSVAVLTCAPTSCATASIASPLSRRSASARALSARRCAISSSRHCALDLGRGPRRRSCRGPARCRSRRTRHSRRRGCAAASLSTPISRREGGVQRAPRARAGSSTGLPALSRPPRVDRPGSGRAARSFSLAMSASGRAPAR